MPPKFRELPRSEQDDNNQQYEEKMYGLAQASHWTNLPWWGLYRHNPASTPMIPVSGPVNPWRCSPEATRAAVLYTIQKVLDDGLPRTYTPELYERKCSVLYQHVFDSYQGLGKGLYAS
jgi:hypothetical protein